MLKKYSPTKWVGGKTIGTADVMNNIEEGILNAHQKVDELDLQIKDIANQLENIKGVGGEGTITSVWAGKKATFYGDSLTEENFQYTKGYHKWIQEILGLTSYENFGVSGYKISDVYNKVNSTTATGDIIFVMCGVNDENFSTPLGNMGDDTTNTIYGSYNKLCSSLKSKYPTKIILFITPHYQTRYPHNDGITSYEVTKAMKEVCEKYAINVYDNYAISGIYPQNATNKNIFTTDGCHWNDLGHEIVGKNLANYILNTYRYVYKGSTSGTTTYTITNNLSNSTSSNSNTSVTEGSSYTATITNIEGYAIASIKVTMGGVDITASAVSENIITISNVTGNIIITVTTTDTSATTSYTITNILTNCTNSNTETSIAQNAPYTATITADTGYSIDSIVVTMGGSDITSTAVNGNVINISSVTGNIVITVTTTENASGGDTGGGSEGNSYIGKTFTITGKKFHFYHLTALIANDSSFDGKTLAMTLTGSEAVNLKADTNISGPNLFADNTGEVTNSAYVSTMSDAVKASVIIDGSNFVAEINNRTIIANDAPYIKVPILVFISGIPASFKIDSLSITIDGKEQPILKLGGFFTEETFTLE